MTKYILSFFAGLSATLLVVFFVKLAQNDVQRYHLSLLIIGFALLLISFAYYVVRRIGLGQKK